MGSDKTDVAVAPSTKKKSDDRFYLLEFTNRPARWGDVGSLLRLQGVVIGGGGTGAVLMLPGTMPKIGEAGWSANWLELSLEEWSDWLQASDSLKFLSAQV